MQKRPKKADANDGERLETLLPDVMRIRDHGRVEHPRKKIIPIARQRTHDEQQASRDDLSDHLAWDISTEVGEELSFLRIGMQSQTLRKLRRGHWAIQRELDLHGHTTPEARRALIGFLQECRRNGECCVRIVHGKGLRSKNREPVLKTNVGNWLRQLNEVLACCQARPADGGSGAVIVLLKSGQG